MRLLANALDLVSGVVLGYAERLRYSLRAAVGDDHVLLWLISRVSARLLDHTHYIHSFDDFAKNDVSTVEPRRLFNRDEELRPIGVLASIGHGQPSSTVVLQLEVLVCEAITIDAATSSAIALCEVSPLDHELFDHPVELAAFVSLTFGLLGKLHEILDRLRNGFAEQADLYSARIDTADLHIEPYLVGDFRPVGAVRAGDDGHQAEEQQQSHCTRTA